MKKEEIEAKIEALEAEMAGADFWLDKVKAQAVVKEHRELKASLIAGAGGQYDAGDAVMTLFAGAGGDDAEDFARMLFEMYQKFATRRGFEVYLIHQNENNHGGYRNLTFEMRGEKAYGTLKGESGVHVSCDFSPLTLNHFGTLHLLWWKWFPSWKKGGSGGDWWKIWKLNSRVPVGRAGKM